LEIKKFLAHCRWFFFRDGFLYLLIFSVALMCVDVPGVVQSVKIRRLNDLVTGINMSQLDAFSKGEIPASAVDWARLMTYFRMIMKFFPEQEDAEMFLGYCEYYGLNQQESAFEHIRRSADNMPYYFWNVYDTGLFLFKKGDYDHAILYLELALLAPGGKALYTMGNSIIYRQFFTDVLNSDFELRLNHAREKAVLLLAAAHYYKGNYDMAGIFARKGVTEPGISDREPFFFYAGAIAMALGHSDEALLLFERAIKAKSKNPQVYRFAADILKKNGHQQEAEKISQMGLALPQGGSPDEFPYPDYLRLKFY
jgi:tetratricopeptide (TPR) repeat protein